MNRVPMPTIQIDLESQEESFAASRPEDITAIKRWLMQGISVVGALILEQITQARSDGHTPVDPQVTPDTSSLDMTCCICMEPHSATQPCVSLPCDTCNNASSSSDPKYAHTSCLTTWIIEGRNHTCPLCRSPLPPAQVQQRAAADSATNSPLLRVLAADDPTAVASVRARLAIDFAAKLMALGLADITLDRHFGIVHSASSEEVDIIVRSCSFNQSAFPGQERPAIGLSGSTGHKYMWEPNLSFTALSREQWDYALRQPDGSLQGIHVQPIYVHEGSHWVLLVARFTSPRDPVPHGYIQQPSEIVVLESCRKNRPAERVNDSMVRSVRKLALDQLDEGRVSFTLPPCPQQTGNSTVCGILVGANIHLILSGKMDPFAAPYMPKSPCTFEYNIAELYEWQQQTLRRGRFKYSSLVGGGYSCGDDMMEPPHTVVPPQSRHRKFSKMIHTSFSCPSKENTERPKRTTRQPDRLHRPKTRK